MLRGGVSRGWRGSKSITSPFKDAPPPDQVSRAALGSGLQTEKNNKEAGTPSCNGENLKGYSRSADSYIKKHFLGRGVGKK